MSCQTTQDFPFKISCQVIQHSTLKIEHRPPKRSGGEFNTWINNTRLFRMSANEIYTPRISKKFNS